MATQYIDLPSVGNGHWKGPVALTINLPLNGNQVGDVRLAEDTNTIYVWNGSSWIAVATPGAAIAIDGLIGDVTATGPGVVPATVVLVGGQSAANVATATALVNTPQSGNKVLASPANGSSGAPAFRALVNADIPNPAFTTKSANYTITSADGTIFCDSSGGAFNLTLPDPTTLVGGKIYRVIDSTGSFGTNNVTLVPHGAEKISGLAANRALQADWGFYTITTNNVDWFLG